LLHVKKRKPKVIWNPSSLNVGSFFDLKQWNEIKINPAKVCRYPVNWSGGI
jgi:hypothetical protein